MEAERYDELAAVNPLLPDGITAIHRQFAADAIPHAFGGAIALTYCSVPGATADIDIYVFLPQAELRRVLDAIGAVVPITDRAKAEREMQNTAQVRLRWDRIPVDVFFSNSKFHDSMATRAVGVEYDAISLPVLSAEDLVICKAAFNRPKDWIDIEAIFKVQDGALDADYFRYWLSEFNQPPDDEPSRRIEAFIRQYGGTTGVSPSG
jgi:hypothetical protein